MATLRIPLACLALLAATAGPAGAHAPTPDFTVVPSAPVAGQPVKFTSTAQPDAGRSIVLVSWDLDGDGSFDAIGDAVGHTYAEPGTYTVLMHVLDDMGSEGTTTRQITVASQPPPLPLNLAPIAGFTVFPRQPLVGEEVALVSYSADPDGRVAEQRWDLDGDGGFDDGAGSLLAHAFSEPGPSPVALMVVDNDGATAVASSTVHVIAVGGAAPTPANPGGAPTRVPRMLAPFPVVRLVGALSGSGVRVRLLAVRGPRSARVLVRCRGRGCPIGSQRKLIGRGRVTFPALRRLLPAGTVVEVFVRKGQRIGKYTRFRIRRGRVPTRYDACLWPGLSRSAPCPED